MGNRLLYISNIADKRMTGSFNGTAILAAKDLGIEFICVANRSKATESDKKLDEEKWGIKLLHVDLARNPFSFLQNHKACNQLVKIIQEYEIDYIHCNTPVGGILGRLAGEKCNVKKVIYQAHGFHFYKGAPMKNWLLYYPVENWLAHYTDALITINHEDYQLAKGKFKLRGNGKVHYVPGVGIDLDGYRSTLPDEALAEKRKEFHIPQDAFVLISVGELNANKNNSVVISALEKLGNKNIHYVLCGEGSKHSTLQEKADKAGLHDNVHFLGYRTDVKELYQMADCFVSASLREGLPRSIMEAMASGLPCIASRIRGNVDLLEYSQLLFDPHDTESLCEALKKAMKKEITDTEIDQNGKAIQCFSTEEVIKAMKQVYDETVRIV